MLAIPVIEMGWMATETVSLANLIVVTKTTNPLPSE